MEAAAHDFCQRVSVRDVQLIQEGQLGARPCHTQACICFVCQCVCVCQVCVNLWPVAWFNLAQYEVPKIS